MNFREKEQNLLDNAPEIWCANLAKIAWGWSYLEGWQTKVVISKELFNIVNCSRQLGKSHTLMLRSVMRALSIPKALELVVAEQRQSNEDLRRARDLCVVYDRYLNYKSDGKVGLALTTDNKTSLELPNGSRIIALPANEKVRGYSDTTDIYIDEAARLPDEVFIALEPIITASLVKDKPGQIFLASSPNGPDGFFWKEWNNPRYTLRIHIPWYKSERLKDSKEFREQIEKSRLIYGEAYVKQEYEALFLDDVNTLFSEESLRSSIDNNQEALSDTMDRIKDMLN